MQTPRDFLKDYIINGGISFITPQEVVAMAEDPESPLHGYFQWDDAIAGHEYRKWQARQLIASIKISVEHKPDTEIRLMVSVPTDRGENGYQLVTEAVKNPSAREELRREIIARVNHWKAQAELLDSTLLRWLDVFPNENEEEHENFAFHPAYHPHGAIPAQGGRAREVRAGV